MARLRILSQRASRSKAWPLTLVLTFVIGYLMGTGQLNLSLLGGGAARTQAAGLGATVGMGGGPALTGRPLAAQHLRAHWSTTPPTRSAQEQQAEQAAVTAFQHMKWPTVTPSAQAAHVVVPHPGPALPNPRTAPRADSDFDVELNATIPASGVCPTDCLLFPGMDSSVANDGKYLMETGIAFASTSADNGATWSYLDPFTLTGAAHFYPTQQLLYEPSRDRMFWALTYFNTGGLDPTNHITIATSGGTDLASWCYYDLHATDVGLGSGDPLIAPQMQYSANFLTLTFGHPFNNAFQGDMTVVRLPLSLLAACSGSITPQYVHRTDTFMPMLAQGATDTLYWGSNTGPGAIGTTLTVFFWPEKSSSYTYQTKTISAFTYLNSGTGNCASQDAVVTNWCANISSATGTAFRSRSGYRGFGAPLISFAWVVGPTQGVSPFPSVVREYFLLANMSYKGADYVYNPNFAVTSPSLSAPVARGYVGGSFMYGGGTGSGGSAQDYYPGSFLLIEDPDTPTAPWSVNYYLPGQKNTGNLEPFGSTASAPWTPDGLHWIATGLIMNNSNTVEEHVAIFGRGRDHNSYLLWSTTPGTAVVQMTGTGPADFQLTPQTDIVKVGTVVEFFNQMPMPLQLQSTLGPPVLNSPPILPGASFAYRFTVAGTYQYIAVQIGPGVTGTITVVS
jgi:hypothetical protein